MSRTLRRELALSSFVQSSILQKIYVTLVVYIIGSAIYMRDNFRRRNLLGFTIFELMLTLAVAAVIVTLGVPSFQTLMERNQLTSNINRFISTLALARSEAIKRNQRVVVCPSADGVNCSNAGGYDNGWIVFTDSNNNDIREPATEELIWEAENVSAGMTLRGTGNFNSAIPYVPSGRLADSAPINGSVRLCINDQTNKARMITIIQSGRVRLNSNNALGVPENGDTVMSNCAT